MNVVAIFDYNKHTYSNELIIIIWKVKDTLIDVFLHHDYYLNFF